MTDFIKTKQGKAAVAFAVVVVAVLAVFGLQKSGMVKNDKRNAYMALRYLEAGEYSAADEYSDKISYGSNKDSDFAKLFTEAVKHNTDGDRTLYSVKKSLLTDEFGTDKDFNMIIRSMDKLDNDPGYLTGVVPMIIEKLDISQKNSDEYKELFTIECSALNGVYIDETQRNRYERLLGDGKSDEMLMLSYVAGGDYGAALQSAADKVNRKSNAENRLLLADIMAQAFNAGYDIGERSISFALGKEYNREKGEKKAENVFKKIEEINEELKKLNVKYELATDADEVSEINDKINELEDQLKILEKYDGIEMLKRAESLIADIPTAKATVVRAKIKYAMGENVTEYIADKSDSIMVKLTRDEEIKQGFDLISQLQVGDVNVARTDTTTAEKVIEKMFTSTMKLPVSPKSDDMYYASFSRQITDEIIGNYKYNRRDINIISVDTSEYPRITFDVMGSEKIIKSLADKKAVVKDTHYPVEYTAQTDKTNAATVCVAVDISGSMMGEPIENAKKALNRFIDTIQENTKIAVVAFDSSWYMVQPVTSDKAALKKAVNSLQANGGTDITSGVRGGLEAVKNGAGSKNIILMTDGQSGFDYSCLDEAKSRGVIIHTVGFGGIDETLLSEIAARTKGSFVVANNSEDLGRIYALLGRTISNILKVSYTVTENPDEMYRYVFVSSHEQTDKYVYMHPDADVLNTADKFWINGRGWYTKDSMIQAEENGQKAVFNIRVSNGHSVNAVEISGVQAEIQNSMNNVTITIDPITEEGAHDIVFRLNDGTDYVAKNGFVVYDRNAEYYKGSNTIRVGCVQLYSGDMLVTSSGEILLGGMEMRDYSDSSSAVQGVNVDTECTVSLKGISADFSGRGVINGGDSGQFTMNGYLGLDRSDYRNTSGSNSVSAIGDLTGTINPQQCEVQIAKQEAGNEG